MLLDPRRITLGLHQAMPPPCRACRPSTPAPC
jgi:hypothetical protein